MEKADLLGDPIRLRQLLGLAKLAQLGSILRFELHGDRLARRGAWLASCAFACASSGWFRFHGVKFWRGIEPAWLLCRISEAVSNASRSSIRSSGVGSSGIIRRDTARHRRAIAPRSREFSCRVAFHSDSKAVSRSSGLEVASLQTSKYGRAALMLVGVLSLLPFLRP